MNTQQLETVTTEDAEVMPSIRIVDINNEILKGRSVKPGVIDVDDDDDDVVEVPMQTETSSQTFSAVNANKQISVGPNVVKAVASTSGSLNIIPPLRSLNVMPPLRAISTAADEDDDVIEVPMASPSNVVKQKQNPIKLLQIPSNLLQMSNLTTNASAQNQPLAMLSGPNNGSPIFLKFATNNLSLLKANQAQQIKFIVEPTSKDGKSVHATTENCKVALCACASGANVPQMKGNSIAANVNVSQTEGSSIAAKINVPQTEGSSVAAKINVSQMMGTTEKIDISRMEGNSMIPRIMLPQMEGNSVATKVNLVNSNNKSLNGLILNQAVTNSLAKNANPNTIIGMPNNVYLIPIQYFQPDNTIRIPQDNKFKYVPAPVTEKPVPPNPVLLPQPKPKEVTKELPKELQKPVKLHHPCFSNRGNRKLDLDGFRMYDRLGFYRAEQQRSVKCAKLINKIVDKQRIKINDLTKETKKIKMQLDLQYFEKYDLKELRIVLDPGEVKRYFDRFKGVKKIRKRSRREKPLVFSFHSETKASLEYINFRNPIQVVNHYNYGSLDYKKLPCTVLFVNSHNLITEMCLETCPTFRNAVFNKEIKIVDKDVLETFLKYNKGIGLNCAVLQDLDCAQNVEKEVRSLDNIKKEFNDDCTVALDHSYAMVT